MPLVAILKNHVEVRINGRDHLPAHIHVIDGTDEALIVIVDGSIYAGAISVETLVSACVYLAANRLDLCDRFFAINNKLASASADVTAKCAELQAEHDAAHLENQQ